MQSQSLHEFINIHNIDDIIQMNFKNENYTFVHINGDEYNGAHDYCLVNIDKMEIVKHETLYRANNFWMVQLRGKMFTQKNINDKIPTIKNV